MKSWVDPVSGELTVEVPMEVAAEMARAREGWAALPAEYRESHPLATDSELLPVLPSPRQLRSKEN